MLGYNFIDTHKSEPFVRVRLETIVHWGAFVRLETEFGWPREHLICESPTVVEDGRELLNHDALDLIMLEHACQTPTGKMSPDQLRSRVVGDAKAHPKELESLIREMRECRAGGGSIEHQEHAKCRGLAVLRPPLFLGVAADQTWRLFTVEVEDGRSVLGDELPDLDRLHYPSAGKGWIPGAVNE
jgi:hypothetical protein